MKGKTQDDKINEYFTFCTIHTIKNNIHIILCNVYVAYTEILMIKREIS